LLQDFSILFELGCHEKIVHMPRQAFVARWDLDVSKISCFFLALEVVKIVVV
jgi:hypothetical protein